MGVGVRVRLPLTLIRPLLPPTRERAWVRPFHLGSLVTISYSRLLGSARLLRGGGQGWGQGWGQG